MKNQIMLIIILLGGSLFAFAQKNTWTLGLHIGIKGEIVKSIEQKYYPCQLEADECMDDFHKWTTNFRTIHTISTEPLIELTAEYKITDYFSIISGIGFMTSGIKWRSDSYWQGVNSHPLTRFADCKQTFYEHFKIPIIFQCNIPIKNKGFSFFAKLGLYLDFSFSPSGSIQTPILDSLISYGDREYKYEFTPTFYRPVKKFNLSVYTGLGFSYQFNSGIGVSLSGAYNIGTLRTDRVSYNLKLKEPNTDIVKYEFNYHLYDRNEYWDILLGITYTFKQKPKERK